MALLNIDYRLQEAIKTIENLGDSHEEELIKYYIADKEKLIKEQKSQIEAFRDWFNKLDRFLPKKNITY